MINEFIKNPKQMFGKIISKRINQFEIDFKEVIIDVGINNKVFSIFKLKDGCEVIYLKKDGSLYQIKKDFSRQKIYKSDIDTFNSFLKKEQAIEGQENYIDSKSNIELIFDNSKGIIESAFYTVVS